MKLIKIFYRQYKFVAFICMEDAGEYLDAEEYLLQGVSGAGEYLDAKKDLFPT